MKHFKKSLFILFFIVSSSTLYAQKEGDFVFGIFAGASMASVSISDNSYDLESRIGVHGGIFGDYYFSKNWSLRSKLYYDEKGFGNAPMELVSGNGRIERESVSIHSITLSVAPAFHFGKNENLFINLGPYASNLRSVAGGSELKKDFKKWDMGLEGGIGFEFSFSKKNKRKYFVAYSGQFGLTALLAEKNEDVSDPVLLIDPDDSMQSRQHSIHVGFRF